MNRDSKVYCKSTFQNAYFQRVMRVLSEEADSTRESLEDLAHRPQLLVLSCTETVLPRF